LDGLRQLTYRHSSNDDDDGDDDVFHSPSVPRQLGKHIGLLIDPPAMASKTLEGAFSRWEP